MANLTYIFLCLAIFQIIQTSGLSSLRSPIRESDSCECGAENNRQGKIVGGEEVQPYRYPWMALVGKKKIDSEKIGLHCGGALINNRYVLTAAHCVNRNRDPKTLIVYLGVHDVKGIYDNKSIGFQVERLIPHEEYNIVTRVNDIGLIMLKEDILPNKYHYLCLPKPDEDYTDKKATAIGWGKMEEFGRSSKKLLEVNLTIISMDDCEKDLFVGNFIKPSMVCTVEEEKDACQGDSGGPLMLTKRMPGNKKGYYWEEIGLVSFGHGCARPGIAAVYTRVAFFVDWIYENTEDALYCMNPNTM